MAKDTEKPPGGSPRSLLADLPPTNPAVIKAFKNSRLANQHYAAIGRVAASWARFEVTIDLWLTEFAGIPLEVGICFTGQMVGPRARVDAFIALVRHMGADAKLVKQLNKLAPEIEAAGRQRNRAVHDVWELSDATTPLRVERTAFKTLRALSVHVPTEELQQFELQVIELDTRFAVLAVQIWDQLHASRDTTPPDTAP
jgi:hypothetical protein